MEVELSGCASDRIKLRFPQPPPLRPWGTIDRRYARYRIHQPSGQLDRQVSSRIINEQVVATPPVNLQPLISLEAASNRDIAISATNNIYDKGADAVSFYPAPVITPSGWSGVRPGWPRRPVTSAISAVQKQRVREVFEFYSSYLGIQFVETSGQLGPD